MALSLFGSRSNDPFDSFLFDPFAFPSFTTSLVRYPENPSFARDVAAVANTQVDWKETSDSHIFKANLPGSSQLLYRRQPLTVTVPKTTPPESKTSIRSIDISS